MDPVVRRVVGRYLIGSETLTVYHATNAPPFEQFDPSLRGTTTDEGHLGAGYYFSTDPNVGKRTKTLLKVRVRIQHPLHLSLPAWNSNKIWLINKALDTTGLRGAAITSEAEKQGYDGVILDYSPVGYHHKEVVAFKTGQIDIVGPVSL